MSLLTDPAAASHWMSYTEYDGPFIKFDCIHSFMVSVVLDAGSHEHFSGIRLMVIHDTDLMKPVIKDCIKKRPEHNQIDGPVDHRKFLLQRRSDLERGKLLLNDNNRSLPLCTVIFKAVVDTVWGVQGMRLIPQPEIISMEPLRIIYDRVYPCTLTCRSVVAFLGSMSHILKPGRSGRLPGIAAHSARIIPCARLGPTFNHLPPSILRRITLIVIEGKGHGWRPILLRLALVCKAWYPLLDLFFETLGTGDHLDHPDPTAVVRTLQQRPDKATLIEGFSAWDFQEAGLREEHAYVRFYEAIVTIIRSAVSLVRVEMACCHFSLSQEYLNALSQLRNVKKCEVYGSGQELRVIRNFTGRYEFGINDMQKCIMNWPDLSEFKMNGWNNTDDGKNDSEIPRFDSAIKYLSLTNGIITGLQLLRFTSPNYPTLRRLWLDDISGFSNSELTEFLLQVSETIVTLSIRRCTISRDTDDEEHALDVAMPKMSRLVKATIVGNIASPLAIERKAPMVKLSGDMRRKEIAIELGSEHLESLAQALQVTGWESVVVFERHLRGMKGTPTLREKVIGVAQERGISLRFTRVPKQR